MIIRSNKNNPHTLVNNQFLNNKNLSWKAKGLLLYLFSLPDNLKIKVEDLKKISSDGKASTESALKELIKHKYITGEKQ